MQQPRRMRIEREDQGRGAQLPGHGQQPLDDPRVSQVDAVEIADRHGAVAEVFGQAVEVAIEGHR